MNTDKTILFLLLYCIWNVFAATTIQCPIGGLLNPETLEDTGRALKTMIEMSGDASYSGSILHSNVTDGYSTSFELCSFTADDSGIVALLDTRPTYGVCDTICLLCNQYKVSYLSVGWDLPDTLANDTYSFAYHPPSEVTSKAFATLIKHLGWDRFTILYEDETSFIRLQEIINSWPYKYKPILYRKLDPQGDNRETFKYIFKEAHMSYHVLDCDVNNIIPYMKEIVQVENSTQYQSFILTALDAYTVPLRVVPQLRANVTTLHMTIADDVGWKDLRMSDEGIRLETALAVDALNHLEKAIRILNEHIIAQREKSATPPPLCLGDETYTRAQYEEQSWALGDLLRNALMNTTSSGFTGNIEFDDDGKRTNFKLYYSKLNNESDFVHTGHWDSKTNIIVENKNVVDRSSAVSSHEVLLVGSREGEPYFMTSIVNGTEVYRGYAVDVINAIFEQIKLVHKIEYKYEFRKVPDNNYGNPIPGTKKWDGLIGALLEHKYELAICDLTITSDRNSAVDFSTPFMTLGISMLFRVPDPEDPNRWSFLDPLNVDVWLYLATAYICVSFVLLICARMSQDDWVNPHPCNQNPEHLQNIWSLYNCMWLTMGSIMTQGCDILPRGVGSRWITGVWWFFALIVTASYTANMSAFISNSRRSNDIKDAKALSEQTSVSYGTMYNASTYKFFESSNDSVYQKIWTVMKSSKPTVFVNSNQEGKERVLQSKGKYVFFMESTTIEYYTKRNCDLMMVGSKLDSKEYGIAMPKNSPLKDKVDNAILRLQENATLDKLKKKWWEDEDNDRINCEESEEEEEDNGSLQMKNTSGIFLVLGFGGILGLIVAVIDFILHAFKIAVNEKISIREAMRSEWRTSLDPSTLKKPAAPARSPQASPSPSLQRERSQSRAVSVLRAASSFIDFDAIY